MASDRAHPGLSKRRVGTAAVAARGGPWTPVRPITSAASRAHVQVS